MQKTMYVKMFKNTCSICDGIKNVDTSEIDVYNVDQTVNL